MNLCLASLAPKVLREKSCKVKSCVLRDTRLVSTILATKVGKRIGLSDNVSFITHHHPKTFSEQMSVIKPLRTTTVL